MKYIIYIVLVFVLIYFFHRNKCCKIDSFKELLHDFSYAHAVVIFEQRSFSRPENSSKIYSIFRKHFFIIFSFSIKRLQNLPWSLHVFATCSLTCFDADAWNKKGDLLIITCYDSFIQTAKSYHISYKYSYWVPNKKSLNVFLRILRFYL